MGKTLQERIWYSYCFEPLSSLKCVYTQNKIFMSLCYTRIHIPEHKHNIIEMRRQNEKKQHERANQRKKAHTETQNKTITSETSKHTNELLTKMSTFLCIFLFVAVVFVLFYFGCVKFSFVRRSFTRVLSTLSSSLWLSCHSHDRFHFNKSLGEKRFTVFLHRAPSVFAGEEKLRSCAIFCFFRASLSLFIFPLERQLYRATSSYIFGLAFAIQ